MAYTAATLMKLGELPLGRQYWAYTTLDAAAVIDTSAYFTGTAIDMLRVGDLIFRTTVSAIPIVETTTTVSAWGIHIVLSNSGTVVDTSDALAGVITDTD